MAQWEKYGLVTQRWFRSRAEKPEYSDLPRAARFRLALEDGGGLFPIFGRFLSGRADLLPSTYLYELRSIRYSQHTPVKPSPKNHISNVSSIQWIRSGPGCDVFSARYQHRAVTLEIYQNSVNSAADPAWDQFGKKVGRLSDSPEAVISQAAVLDEFWEWLRLHSDIEKKQTIVANLQKTPENCINRFPELIPKLQSSTCLAYESMSGVPLNEERLCESGSGVTNLQILVEALLEQSLLLSVIDSDVELENFLILPDGNLGFRTLPCWTPVAVERHYELLQYVASSSAGDSQRALQMLCRMTSGGDSSNDEQQLLRKLSSLKPELKINAFTPESVTRLENYWRAVAATSLRLPLFLQLFHRNITLLGQYNEGVNPSKDLVEQALWPVVGRILRLQVGELLSVEKTREWVLGSGLLFMITARQMARAAEALRENNSDVEAALDLKNAKAREDKLDRRTANLVTSGIVLAVLLFSIEVALSVRGGAMRALAGAAAVISAAALSFLISRVR